MSARGGGRLIILLYHRVLPRPDPLRPFEPDTAGFEWRMKALATHFNVLPLSKAVNLLKANELPERAACITFDDGYADNANLALPILKKFNLPATFFVAAGFLDRGRMWNDTVIESVRKADGERLDLRSVGLDEYDINGLPERRFAAQAILNELKYLEPGTRSELVTKIADKIGSTLPDNLMMQANDLKALINADMEIGGHTITHPILTRLSHRKAHEEIAGGKKYLEDVIGQPVSLFAYPNGQPLQDYDNSHVKLARDIGFEAAVTTSWGVASSGCDPMQLPRFTPWDTSPFRFVVRLMHHYTKIQPQLC